MKKLAFIIIIFICISAFLAGCANDQYAIEKQYWQIKKQASKIFNNPDASPPRELERMVNILNSFAQKYPQYNLSVEAEFDIARLYMVKKEYDKARAQLNTMINKHNKTELICAEAVFLMGNSYEIEDKWNLALDEYKKIELEYPATPRGLNTPVYIAQYYQIKHQPDKMIAAFQEAIGHYNALADKYPNSLLAYSAHNLVAQCYIAIKDWQNALKALNTIIVNYKGKVSLDRTMMDMALIYNRELKDKAKAKELLEGLIKDYPKSKLIKIATALLKEMEKK